MKLGLKLFFWFGVLCFFGALYALFIAKDPSAGALLASASLIPIVLGKP